MEHVFTALAGFWLGALVFSTSAIDDVYIKKAKEAKIECERVIPRNQVCGVLITAEPIKNEGENK